MTNIELENRLKEWAIWIIRDLENGQVYPRCSSFVNANSGSHATSIDYTMLNQNPRAEEVNNAYRDLMNIYPVRAKILKEEYTSRENTAAQRAIKLHVERGYYFRQLLLAKTFVEARLL